VAGLDLAERLFGETGLYHGRGAPYLLPSEGNTRRSAMRHLTLTLCDATAPVPTPAVTHRRPQRGSADALTVVACAIATIAQVLISVKTGLML
jgi:hypothetical protein